MFGHGADQADATYDAGRSPVITDYRIILPNLRTDPKRRRIILRSVDGCGIALILYIIRGSGRAV